jgi:hypothetical protein
MQPRTSSFQFHFESTMTIVVAINFPRGSSVISSLGADQFGRQYEVQKHRAFLVAEVSRRKFTAHSQFRIPSGGGVRGRIHRDPDVPKQQRQTRPEANTPGHAMFSKVVDASSIRRWH